MSLCKYLYKLVKGNNFVRVTCPGTCCTYCLCNKYFLKKKRVVAYFKLLLDSVFPLEGLRKTTRNVSHYKKFHGRNSDKRDNYRIYHNRTMSAGAEDCDRNIRRSSVRCWSRLIRPTVTLLGSSSFGWWVGEFDCVRHSRQPAIAVCLKMFTEFRFSAEWRRPRIRKIWTAHMRSLAQMNS